MSVSASSLKAKRKYDSMKHVILLLILTSYAAAQKADCPTTKIINKTKFNWNKMDDAMLKIAIKHCSKKKNENVCLIQFIKQDRIDYHGLCGIKR